MAIQFTTTDQAAVLQGAKVLVYGPAGIGKTVLCSTAPEPFLISAESGILSLRGKQIAMAKVSTMEEVIEIYDYFAQGKDQWKFKTVCLDSISEIAEVCLSNAKRSVKDPRQAYGQLLDTMEKAIRAFRDLPGRHVIMTAKQEPMKDELTGVVRYGPAMPGAKLGPRLGYYYDFVFRMGINKDAQGKDFRFLQTQPDFQFEAKDRSGALNPIEVPNLAQIFQKIGV